MTPVSMPRLGVCAALLFASAPVAQEVFVGHARPHAFATGLLSSTVYFAASDAISGVELWRTDGTAGGTVAVADVRPGREGSMPRSITVLPGGGEVFFSADDGTRRSVYRYRAATSAATQVTPILDDPDEIVCVPTAAGPRVYATAKVAGVRGLYQVTGGAAVAVPIPAGTTDPGSLVAIGDRLAFAAQHPTLGIELFVHAPGGSTVVHDVHPTADSDPCDLTPFAGELCFSATHPAWGRELFSLDPVTGVVRRFDVRPGPAGSSPEQLSTGLFALWFTAYDGSSRQLHKLLPSGGVVRHAAVGMLEIDQITPIPSPFAGVGDVWFRGRDGMTGYEPWRVSTPTGPPTLAHDVLPGNSGSAPRGFVPTPSGVVFRAGGALGEELFVSNGSALTPLGDLKSHPTEGMKGDFEPSRLIPIGFGSRWVFAGEGGTDVTTSGRELWTWDGTGDPRILKNIKPSSRQPETLPRLHLESDMSNLDFDIAGADAGSLGALLLSPPGSGVPQIVAGIRGALMVDVGTLASVPFAVSGAGTATVTIPIPGQTVFGSVRAQAVSFAAATISLSTAATFGVTCPTFTVGPPGPVITVRRCCSQLDDKTGEYRICVDRLSDPNTTDVGYLGIIRFKRSGERHLLEVRTIDPGQALELRGQIDLGAPEVPTDSSADQIEIRLYNRAPTQATVDSGVQVDLSYC